MVNQLTRPGKRLVKEQVYWQLVLMLLGVGISYLSWGLLAAQSVLFGALVAIVPNLVFALKAFKYAGAQAAKQVFNAFVSGLKWKMVITALLFAFCFKLVDLSLAHFFISYCLILVVPTVYAMVNRIYFNQQ